MSDTTRQDMKILGAGTVGGGTYGEVVIAGSGTVSGDVVCTRFKVGGLADVHGSLTADAVTVGGSATFQGDLKADEVTFSGTADVRGSVIAGTLKVSGTASIAGGCTATRVEIKGTTKVGGDVEAEVFEALGVFSIGGLLNAGTVEVRLYGGCDAHDIGGERIDVRLANTWTFLPFWGDRNLTADTIEGDTVYLENTRAKVVRGVTVEIGPGCDIDLVEYTGSLTGTNGVKASRKVEVATQGS